MLMQEQQLIRSIDCFNEAVMFIDVSAPKWKVLHLNTAAQTRLKLHGVACSTDEGSNSLLWDMFQVRPCLHSGGEPLGHHMRLYCPFSSIPGQASSCLWKGSGQCTLSSWYAISWLLSADNDVCCMLTGKKTAC